MEVVKGIYPTLDPSAGPLRPYKSLITLRTTRSGTVPSIGDLSSTRRGLRGTEPQYGALWFAAGVPGGGVICWTVRGARVREGVTDREQDVRDKQRRDREDERG